MEILTASQMEEADGYTIRTLGIPSAVLMENAARGVADLALAHIGAGSVAVVAGGGNNGGDGFAAARLLANAGADVTVFLASDPDKLKGDALLNYQLLRHFPLEVAAAQNTLPDLAGFSVIIDALFGTGLSRPLSGHYASLAEAISTAPGFTIAVDMPSGLFGSHWQIPGPAVQADATITFCRPKIAHMMFPARAHCGEVFIHDISIPDQAVSRLEPALFWAHPGTIPMLPARPRMAHKGSFGHALIIGGSLGKTGAPALSARAASRTGSGLVSLMLPAGIAQTGFAVTPEVMGFAAGTGADTAFTRLHAPFALTCAADKTVLAIGPGIGRAPETAKFVRELITQTTQPLVIDADGLYNIAPDTLAAAGPRAVITPHIGEFARLAGVSQEEVLENRLALAKDFAVRHHLTLVLKSADTIITTPRGRQTIVNRGNAALAKGGSGDALTGIITGLISQGLAPEDAAVLGSYTLGLAAERLTETMNERTVLTGDVIETLSAVFDEFA